MIKVSKQQAFERWDTLPDAIREALVSEESSDFVWDICSEEHLSGEKTKIVSRFIGYVLFGFLHPADLAKELRDALGIDIRITQVIADAVQSRIFKPLQAEIDAVYAPPGAIRPVVLAGVGPKVIEEIEPIVPVAAKPKAPFTPGGVGVIVAKPTFPQSNESMWSKANGGSGSSPSMASKLPPSLGTPIPGQPTATTNIPRPPIVGNLQKTEMGKIPRPDDSRFKMQDLKSNGSAVTGSASVATPAPAPMPVFLGGEAPVRPIMNTPQFMPKSFDRMASAGSVSARPPVPPAVVEFGIPKPPATKPRASVLLPKTGDGNVPLPPKP
ncbi:MAG: hypothetical protein KGJ13_11125 [Patescibacteria group bacterium]|nr:hypothetical protein [Patescibacteria group bacterium]